MEERIIALIHSFRPENGFGILELEDGREVLFDVSACVEEPLEGQEVQVVLGTDRRSGAVRAVLVEPADTPASTRPVTTLREAVRRLQAEGIALELDEYEIVKSLRAQGLSGDSPSYLVPLLEDYYRDRHVGDRRRNADLFAGYRPGDDLHVFESELTQVLGQAAVVFRSEESNLSSVDDVVDAFNEELRGHGDARRIVPLEIAGEGRAYFCMALARATRLSAVRVLSVRWDRPHLTPSEPPLRQA
jgi:cold shock CspA family protein